MSLQERTASVLSWLRQQHVMVLDEWVQACIEWLQSEDQECLNNPIELRQMVYEQWLDSDLTDIGTPILPNGISQQPKGHLNGNYILQVISLRDVSTPAYNQLIKIRGKENENTNVTATQHEDRFEPQSSRMLMLQLTDGHQQIQGMEFAPVQGLSVNTSPGTKIQFCGDIEYRLGVLILSPQHVRVLGGEVDGLVETNNQDAILAQVLGQPAIPLDQQNQPPPNQAPQQLPTINQPGPVRSHQDNVDHPMTNDAVPDDPFPDDFGDDDFDELMLQGIEEIELQQGNTNSNNTTAHHQDQKSTPFQGSSTADRNTNHDIKPSIKTDNTQQNSMHGRQNQSGSFTGRLNQPSNNNRTPNQPNVFNRSVPNSPGLSSSKPNVAVACRIEKGQSLNQRSSNQGFNTSNSSTGQIASSASNIRTLQDNKPQAFVKKEVQNTTGFVKFEHSTNAAINKQTSSGFVKHGQSAQASASKTVIKFEPFSNKTSQANVFQSADRTTVKSESSASATPSAHRGVQSAPKSNTAGFAQASAVKHEHGSNPYQPSHAASMVKSEPAEFGRVAQRPSVGSDIVHDVSTGSSMDEDDMVAAKRRRFYSGQGSASEPSHNLPYSTLLIASRKHAAKQNSIISVKGFIMTLVSSLTCKKGWNVTAKINDGTASMDVDLGNEFCQVISFITMFQLKKMLDDAFVVTYSGPELLTRLIGFSVPELMQMRKDASRASGERQAVLKQQMQQGLEKCQEALIDMSCIMTLETRPELERPLMLTIRDVNEADCLTLIHQLER